MSEQPTRDPIIDLLGTTQRETQDLASALCQVHADRVKDLLARDLRDQMVQVITERFSQLELSLRPRMARARLEVACGITQVLSDAFSRMRRFESDRHWCDALLDAAGALSRRSAFFSIRDQKLCWQGVRGLNGMLHAPATEVPLEEAPAFDRVAETGAATQAARSAADLSSWIAGAFGDEPGSLVLLTPVSAEGRVLGVLYAEDPVDPSAMQAIASFAGLVLERHLRVVEPPRSSPGTVRAVVVEHGVDTAAPSYSERPTDPAAARAKRFARVEVARMILDSEEAVVRGRMTGDLYGALREQIDAVRTAYRGQFNGSRDYLHEEMVRTLARDNDTLLGGDYPGPLS
jgi:hypothetical protein